MQGVVYGRLNILGQIFQRCITPIRVNCNWGDGGIDENVRVTLNVAIRIKDILTINNVRRPAV